MDWENQSCVSESMLQRHFIVHIKCYLLSWQVSEAGFPVTGVAHMQWVATSKMSIHLDRGQKKKKKEVEKERQNIQP